MSDLLDDLISEGFKELPRPKSNFTGNTLPTKRPSVDDESRFLRYVVWYHVRTCTNCNHIWEVLDGIYQEREWLNPAANREGKHWIYHHSTARGLKMEGRLNREHKVDYCPNCLPTDLPVLETHHTGDVLVTFLSRHRR